MLKTLYPIIFCAIIFWSHYYKILHKNYFIPRIHLNPAPDCNIALSFQKELKIQNLVLS